MNEPHKKLRPSGGYRKTASFQTATLIYAATYWFCERFLDSRSRTIDQMVQAARSGRQNIAEGSRAAATSSQTELRLVNVARASLEELLLDYEDYLRHRRLPQWPMDSPEASEIRAIPRTFRKDPSDPSDLTDLTDQQRWDLYSPWLDHENPPSAQTPPSASSTRPTTCSTARSPHLKPPSSRTAATPSNSPPSACERGKKIGRMCQIRPIKLPPPARSAVPSWPCAPPNPVKTPALNSGAAPTTRNAKKPPRCDRPQSERFRGETIENSIFQSFRS